MGGALAKVAGVQIGFVDPHPFKVSTGRRADGRDMPGFLAIMLHARWHKDTFGTQTSCGGAGHGRADAKPPRFITGRAHDSALRWRTSHNDRLSAQSRMVALLDRGIEGIHVEVE